QTVYIYNNVVWNAQTNNALVSIDTTTITESAYIYNNTLVGRAGSGQSCGQINQRNRGPITRFVVENNHCITDGAAWCVGGSCAGATTFVNTKNTVMSSSVANSQGYTASE